MSEPRRVYRIRNWKGCFEVSQNGACKTWSWIAVPIKHDGKSFRRLMALPNGQAIYGAWILIAAVAAKCEPRGTLLDDGVPLTAEDLHFKTGAPEALFAEALEALKSDRIGWLELVELEHARASLEHAQGSLELPDITGPDSTGHNKTPEPESGDFSNPIPGKAEPQSGANGRSTAVHEGKSIFRKITTEDLRDDAVLLLWFEAALKRDKPVVKDSESDLLNVFAAAEHALGRGKKPPALFATVVGKRNWKVISAAEEARASDRIKRLRAATEAAAT